MGYETYKLIHVAAALLVFLSLGGAAVHAANGGTRASNAVRGLVGATHGLGLLALLIAGFGLLARLGLGGGLPPWVWGKLVLWVLLAGMIALPYRRPGLTRGVWIASLVLGALAAYLGIFKPG